MGNRETKEVILSTTGNAAYIFQNWNEFERWLIGGPLTAKVALNFRSEQIDPINESAKKVRDFIERNKPHEG